MLVANCTYSTIWPNKTCGLICLHSLRSNRCAIVLLGYCQVTVMVPLDPLELMKPYYYTMRTTHHYQS